VIDPDSEVITAAEVGAANTGDAAMASALPADLRSGDRHRDAAAPKHGAAYGTGALLAELDRQAISAMTKLAAPTPRGTSPSSSSASTWTPGGSPSRPTFSCRSSRPATVVGWPASAAPANSARCKLPAPAARLVGGSPSTPRRPGCRRPGSGSGSGSGLAGRLPHPPAHRGTQARPPATPPARRPPRPLRGLVRVTQGLAAASRGGHLVLQPHLA
jgi:hypothetical protein